jgi:hypothetical protein
LQIQLLKKTGIQAVNLSLQQLKPELLLKGVDDSTALETAKLFEIFEMARYAALTPNDNSQLINRTENVIHLLNKFKA